MGVSDRMGRLDEQRTVVFPPRYSSMPTLNKLAVCRPEKRPDGERKKDSSRPCRNLAEGRGGWIVDKFWRLQYYDQHGSSAGGEDSSG